MYTSKSSKPILLLVDIVCLLLASYVHDSARQLPNAVQISDPAGGGGHCSTPHAGSRGACTCTCVAAWRARAVRAYARAG